MKEKIFPEEKVAPSCVLKTVKKSRNGHNNRSRIEGVWRLQEEKRE